jgi:hypothetical protein
LKGIIREALRVGDQLIETPSCRDLVGIARDRKIDVAVIDPGVFGGNQVGSALEFAKAFPKTAIVVYTVASAITARALIKLREFGVTHALLYPFDYSPGRVREEFSSARRDHLVLQFLELLARPLKALPSALQSTIRQMFATSHFATASDLSLAAGMPESGVYRWFETAGLEPPKRLLLNKLTDWVTMQKGKR